MTRDKSIFIAPLGVVFRRGDVLVAVTLAALTAVRGQAALVTLSAPGTVGVTGSMVQLESVVLNSSDRETHYFRPTHVGRPPSPR